MDATQRRLVVLRHAKSAWPEGVPDRERPLAARGRRDAPAAGAWLQAHVGRIDAAVCSPATRARGTWELVAAELAEPPVVRYDERIYDASTYELRAVVQDLPDAAGTAILVGHNPGLEQLATLLTGHDVVLKTSSLVVAAWTGGWGDGASATLQHLETPRG